MTGDGTGYRRDIDGLRAVAVILVLIYHFNLLPISGGFVGVDVFFVVSGYVIARSIGATLDRGSPFRLSTFMLRRLMRLVPSVLLVVLTALALGWFFLPSGAYASLALVAASSVFFVSNVIYSRKAGYFAPDAEMEPLLHTWSLGVEEQFYIVAPLLIAGMYRKRLGRFALAIVLVSSFLLACRAGWREDSGSYFLPHHRAFEFVFGVALATHVLPLLQHTALAGIVALAGIGLIVFSAVCIDPTMAFPGPWAAVPCIGAACIIWSGERQRTMVARCLSAAPLVSVGQRSYAIYLWHWPMLVFCRLWFEHEPAYGTRLALLAACLAVAWGSYATVEKPLRQRGIAGHRGWAITVGIATVGTAALAYSIYRHSGLPQRFSPAIAAYEMSVDRAITTLPFCRGDVQSNCRIGAMRQNIDTLVWGDSHAFALGPIFDVAAKAENVSSLLVSRGGCPPLVDASGRSARATVHCQRIADRVKATLSENPSIRHVILHARWPLYSEGQSVVRPTGGTLAPFELKKAREVFDATIVDTVRWLTTAGYRVDIIGPVPEFTFDVPSRLLRDAIRRSTQPRQSYSLDRSVIEARQAAMTASMARAGALPHVTYHGAIEAFCDAETCASVQNDQPWYRDNNHLTRLGGERLLPMLRSIFAQKQALP